MIYCSALSKKISFCIFIIYMVLPIVYWFFGAIKSVQIPESRAGLMFNYEEGVKQCIHHGLRQ